MSWTELHLGGVPPWDWPLQPSEPASAADSAETNAKWRVFKYGAIPLAICFFVGLGLLFSSNPTVRKAGLITMSGGNFSIITVVTIAACIAGAKARYKAQMEEPHGGQ